MKYSDYTKSAILEMDHIESSTSVKIYDQIDDNSKKLLFITFKI